MRRLDPYYSIIFLVSDTSDVFTKAAYEKSRYRPFSVVKKW